MTEIDVHTSWLIHQRLQAERLNRAATFLIVIAWIEASIIAVGGLVAGVAIIDAGDNVLAGIGAIVGGSAAAVLVFAGTYLAPAWARAWAARSITEVVEQLA